MKEVSCKAFPVLFKEMEKNNYPLEIICKGISYDLDYLRKQKNNIEWDVFCQVWENTRVLWNDDDYERIGRHTIEWRVLPVLSAMIGMYLTPKELYRMMTSHKKGIGNQVFRCVTATFRDIDKNNIEILAEIPEGYRNSREFWLITKGCFSAAPLLIKHKSSHITMEETQRGALYKISFPASRNLFTRLKQFVSFPSSKAAAIRELNESYEQLYERYIELEESKARIQKHQAERMRISSDLHDEIGSSLSSISMYSAYAKEKPEEAAKALNAISLTAGEMIENMNDIIWAINPGNDSFGKIISRLRNYASRMAESKNISLIFVADDLLLEETLSMNLRKNIYLICKEAVNNAVKYSDCKNLAVKVEKNNGHISVEISDDGKGFDTLSLGEGRGEAGYGLQNMKLRAEQAGGNFSIQSSPGTGTKINFEMKLC